MLDISTERPARSVVQVSMLLTIVPQVYDGFYFVLDNSMRIALL